MASREQLVLTGAESILRKEAAGMTGEALARAVAKVTKQPIPVQILVTFLRRQPQRFVESEGGRWQLRQRPLPAPPVDEEQAERPEPVSTPQAITSYRPGCYVVFDLEATRQNALSEYNEIIQIAAQRWIDGVAQEAWQTFVAPSSDLPQRIIQLTKITPAELEGAPGIAAALSAFFAFVGDLPVVAHNGASYDGPLIVATCQRLGLTCPPAFGRVLDTLPLARVLLPTAEAHRVGTLAAHFGCERADAHRADADVEMLGGVVQGLQRIIHEETSGAAAYTLLKKSDTAWAKILTAPAHKVNAPEVIASFGTGITPLLPERAPTTNTPLDAQAIEEAVTQAEGHGRGRREAQIEMSKLAVQVLNNGGYAVIEAGTGTGKSQGYLLPAALYARSQGRPVAVSTNTRLLQTQLVERELPFIRELFSTITYSQLQGRSNYLSLSRLAEEVEDALGEGRLSEPRAWILATLIRFAALSRHGNLEELGYTPQALEAFLDANGAILQTVSSVRASRDDPARGALANDFYQRARENADRAELVVINHALLLTHSLVNEANDEGELPFGATVICDEAHTLEDAASTALEQRVEERVARRVLRAIYDPNKGSGLVNDSMRKLRLTRNNPAITAMEEAVDQTHAALDSLAQRLHAYVNNQTVVAREDLKRYGIRIRIDGSAYSLPGGTALRDASTALGQAFHTLRSALATLGTVIENAPVDEASAVGRRKRRMLRLTYSLQRDLRAIVDHYQRFWQFRETNSYVHIIELEKQDEGAPAQGVEGQRAPVKMIAVPINVGPLMWQRLWSQLDTAICTSATLTVYGQGFNFFLSRIGLEKERVSLTSRQLLTAELPHAFDYNAQALLMLPNDLPAPRDSDLKRNFPNAVADLLQRFIPFFEGKTLGLFTSNMRRDMVYERIADVLAEQGFPLLVQGMGSQQRLIDEFRQVVHSSLLGSRSLWEGVDVPGESLSYVFLEKLPYPSLGDPIESARMSAVENAGGNSFYGYLLPKMITVLKQGFGRLIRRSDDKGVVILLDKRLRSSLYRTEVLRSLPNPKIGTESGNELFEQVADWMGIPFRPEDLPQPTVPDIQRILREQQLPTAIVAEEDFATVALPRLLAVQKAIWNQDSFKDNQQDIIRDVLTGKDVLTLLPTGAGKSRTYQLPALIRPGLTLVISPLIALIRDQVEKLREVPGLTCVASLVSGMSAASQEEVLLQTAQGHIKLLYVSPERLRDPRFQAYLPTLPLLQLVIDEAHCISTWGHDFRPDFLEIMKRLTHQGEGGIPVHALTATATRRVQDEIKQNLRIAEYSTSARPFALHAGSFVRANILYHVHRVLKRNDRDRVALSIVHQLVQNRELGGSGIVYVATRRTATQFARLLRDHNIAAQAYHGGMETAERHQIQERFMQGELDVVVATSAFGMGVDKAEIRFVLHYDHPSSLEAYAQEAGRAGRDNKPAYAILLYHPESERLARFIANQSKMDKKILRAYRNAVLALDNDEEGNEQSSPVLRMEDNTIICTSEMLAQQAEIEPTQARILLYAFENAGLITRDRDCTIEATILPNHEPEHILASIQGEVTPLQYQRIAATLTALNARKDMQATYGATTLYKEHGIDPRSIDEDMIVLARHDLVIYRPYARGITLKVDTLTRSSAQLSVIEDTFDGRFLAFEERLETMRDYIQLKANNGNCRSTFLINYLTGSQSEDQCHICDLCDRYNQNLPWSASTFLYGEKLSVNVEMLVLGAVRDHNGVFGQNTIERILLGQSHSTFPLAKTARASDHFGALEHARINQDRVRRSITALLHEGFLQLLEKPWRGPTSPTETPKTWQALTITRKGYDALAGGIPLPAHEEIEITL